MAAIFTRFAFVLWVIFVDFYSNIANAELVVKPKDTVVLVNQPTYFNCSTSVRNISASFVVWYHYPSGSPSRNDVYDEGQIMHEYKDRFRNETNVAEGVFNLVVERPTVADAGRYECQDGVGQGDKASAELVILERNPICESNMHSDGVIGPNSCGLKPDEFVLTCRITSYHGNTPPSLEWKESDDESSSSLAACERSVSCNLTQRGDQIRNGQSFVCQTAPLTTQNRCSVGPVKVKYAVSWTEEITEGKGDVCSSNTSLPCIYKWYNSKNEEVSADENLHTTIPGEYKCEAQCDMNRLNESCIFIAMRVFIVSPDNKLFALFLLLAIPLICIIVWCFRKKFAQANGNNTNMKKDRNSTHLAGVRGVVNVNLLPPLKQSSLSPEKDPRPLTSKEFETLSVVPVKRSAPARLLTYEEPETAVLLVERSPPDAVDGQSESFPKLCSSLPIIMDQDMVDTVINNQTFIDRGTSGAIYGPFKWQDKKCALKQILHSPDKLTEEKKEEITQLRSRCKKLDHPHLVKVFEVWFPSPALYIVMEYAEGKSLDKILRPKDPPDPLLPFPLKVVQDWALQIADGMSYLHGENLVHRNLKAAHVLVMESPDTNPKTLKIGSYTLAKEHDHSTVMSLKGTMAWMAPEYIRGDKFSVYSDVWSYGVTVWEILTRDVPYKEIRKETDLVRAAMDKKLELKIPESCPEQLRTVLTECWNYAVDKRPSFTEICDNLSGNL